MKKNKILLFLCFFTVVFLNSCGESGFDEYTTGREGGYVVFTNHSKATINVEITSPSYLAHSFTLAKNGGYRSVQSTSGGIKFIAKSKGGKVRMDNAGSWNVINFWDK